MINKITNSRAFFWFLLAMVALLWGMSFFGSTVALEKLKPMELLSMRWTISAILFATLYLCGKIKLNYKGKPTKYLLILAFIQPCCYAILEIWGINLTTTSESSVIIALIPIVVILISQLILKEKYSIKVKAAIAIAFAGVAISVCFAPTFSIGGKGLGYLCLFAAITTGGIFNIMSSKISKYYSAVEITFVMALSGAVFFTAISLGEGNGLNQWHIFFTDSSAMWSTLYLGVGCSFLAYLTYNYVLSKLPAGIASCLQANSITVVGVVSGILLVGDSFGWYTVVGLVLMTIGIGVTSLEGNKDLVNTEAKDNTRSGNYELIIFDLDGTLLYTVEDITDSINTALKNNNMPTHDISEVERYLGNGFELLVRRAVTSDADEDIIYKVLRDFRRIYKANCTIKTKPYEGIIELIDTLKSSGYLIAIATNKNQSSVDILRQRFFDNTIETAIGSSKSTKRKPDPYIINTIINKYGIDRNKVLYIGDSEVDIHTAENAAVTSVIVTWGFRSCDQLKRAGATNIVSKPEDILNFLKNI